MRGASLALGLICASACGGSGVGSIGAVLGRDNETRALYVRELPRGLGAERAGLLRGDEIVMIDGIYARALRPKELRALLRGDIGTPIDLTVVRGGQVRRVTITRTELGTPEEKPREEKISE